MSKPVIYIAHPVSGDPVANCDRTETWIREFIFRDPSRVYIAPWLGEVRACKDLTVSPEFYDRVLEDDQDVVAKLDGLIAVGGKWSRGMRLEGAVANDVMDWTVYETPDDVPQGSWEHLIKSSFGKPIDEDINF